MATFCAVIMAKEDQSVIDRVVDYYIAKGAAKVVVYFDGEPDFSMDDRGDRLRFIVCDESFWQPITGGTPEAYDIRQVGIYEHAISSVSQEWVFFVDCDEYLVSDRPISAFLDDVPAAENILRIPNVEAVWGPGDNRDEHLGARWFRTATGSPIKQRALKLIYGDVYHFMGSGLLGHSAGKHFVRSGQDYQRTSPHTSVHSDGRPGKWADELLTDDVIVCHFDAMNYERWRKKFEFRFRTKSTFGSVRKSRERMIDLIGDSSALGDAQLRKLFERLYCISPLQAFVLKALRLAYRREIF